MSSVDQTLQAAWKIHQAGDIQQAHSIYFQVAKANPEHANAWCYLGIALHDLRRYSEAIEAYRRAIELNPHFPIAYNNLGNSLRYDLRPEEAEQAFQKALSFDPNYVNAHKNRGTLHAWSGNYELALESYMAAQYLEPDDPEIHRNLGVIHLLKGDFTKGWEEYRWRWKCKEATQYKFPVPKWSGQPLEGKTILLYAEQGLGDTLHFIRFAKVVQEMGARTIVHAPGALMALLQGVVGIDVYLPNTMPIDLPFDYHCSLLDVADVLQITDKNIPAAEGYLRPPQYLVPYWKRWLANLPESRLRVGLNWQGNRDHQADKFRSIPLTVLQPLSDLPGIQFISLQQGYGTEQLSSWKGSSPLISLPEGTDQSSGAFMDTSAIVSQLDLVITSDTSVAHLAGAMGRPAWVMLNKMPDWRWFLEGEDSPWYQSLRLFRQPTQGDWLSVVQQIRLALSIL